MRPFWRFVGVITLRRSRDIVDHVGILPKYFARVFTSAQTTVIRMYTGGIINAEPTLEERVPDDHQAEAA